VGRREYVTVGRGRKYITGECQYPTMTDDEFGDALGALTHEVRADILRELADADGPLPFSTLRERVGVRDSGRFNYHLTALCRGFVREADGGYDLTHRGERVVLVAGAERPLQTVETAGDDGTCPVCGEADCDRLVHVHLDSPMGRRPGR
jgi:hypothetical protein